MASPVLVFPSLSRESQPSTVLKFEDGTISDPMESGVVSTRPRFPRIRRTWSVNYRSLTQLDLVQLDQFVQLFAKVGAGSFYFPNQVRNGGMEIAPGPGSDDLVDGWLRRDPIVPLNWTMRTEAAYTNTGFQSIYVSIDAGQDIPVGLSIITIQGRRRKLPYDPKPGETYVANVWVLPTSDGLAAGVTSVVGINLVVEYSDGTSQTFFGPNIGPNPGNAIVWHQISLVATLAADKQCVALYPVLQHGLFNANGAPWHSAGLPIDVRFDDVGLALSATSVPYGLMAGLNPIPSIVRFTKAPQVAQIGVVAGTHRFTCAFDITEV